MPKPVKSPYEAVEDDLEAMPEAVRDSGLAASALTLAKILTFEVTARDASAVARELRNTLAELRAMASAAPSEVDPLDELAAKRSDRLADADVSKRAAGGDVGGSRGRGSRGKRGTDS